PTFRDHPHLKPKHESRVKERDRSHHGLGAPRRMKTRIPRIDTNGSKPDSGLMQFVIIRAISVFGCAALLISLLIPVAQMHAQTQAAMNAQVRAEFEQA